MKSFRKAGAVGAGLLLAGFGTIAGAPDAHASVSQCRSGYVCLWGSNNYSGCFAGFSGNVAHYSTHYWQQSCAIHVHINDGANSVKNDGNNCNVVFYQDQYYSGPAIEFNNANTPNPHNYEDPYLKNGGGVGWNGNYGGQNWQNRISSHAFCQ